MRNRPRQLLRIQFGLCPDCGEDYSAPGGLRCAVCRDSLNFRHRFAYQMQRKSGLPRRTPEKFQEIAQSVAQKRRDRISRGECIQCGRKVSRFIRCTRCMVLNSEAKKRYRERNRAATLEAQKEPLTELA